MVSSSRLGSTLPLRLYADVRLHILMTNAHGRPPDQNNVYDKWGQAANASSGAAAAAAYVPAPAPAPARMEWQEKTTSLKAGHVPNIMYVEIRTAARAEPPFLASRGGKVMPPSVAANTERMEVCIQFTSPTFFNAHTCACARVSILN